MCGGCNLVAESAGASVIVARYWWVARQGRKAVAAAEQLLSASATEVAEDAVSSSGASPTGRHERAGVDRSSRSQ